MDTGRWREPSGSLSATMSKKEESQQWVFSLAKQEGGVQHNGMCIQTYLYCMHTLSFLIFQTFIFTVYVYVIVTCMFIFTVVVQFYFTNTLSFLALYGGLYLHLQHWIPSFSRLIQDPKLQVSEKTSLIHKWNPQFTHLFRINCKQALFIFCINQSRMNALANTTG
jgi:hypothetical protein